MTASRTMGPKTTVQSFPAIFHGGNAKEANDEGIKYAKKLWPVADGWSNHQASAQELSYKDGKQIAITMLAREDLREEIWSAILTIWPKPAKQ